MVEHCECVNPTAVHGLGEGELVLDCRRAFEFGFKRAMDANSSLPLSVSWAITELSNMHVLYFF